MKKKQWATATKSEDLINKFFNKKRLKNIDWNDAAVIEHLKMSDFANSTKLKEHFDGGTNTPKWTINYAVHLYKTEVLKTSVLLVRMILRDGKIHSFDINASKPVFFYQKGAYVIDSSKIKEDVTSGHGSLLYHQEMSLPLGTMTDIEQSKNLIYEHDSDDIKEIRENINPNILRSTVLSTLIKQVMAGGLLDKQLKSFFLIMIINVVLTIILLVAILINSVLG